MARNKFKAAINHIKSTQIDERIQRLNEAPTNSMSNVYDLSPPGQRYGEKDPEKTFYANADGSWPAGVPGTPGERKYIRPRGYWEEGPGTVPSVQHDEVVELDFSYNTQTDDPRNTKTLIDETTGRVKTELPPNSRSFILGPLVDLYFHNHGYDNRTYVGYIQKDTRSFVLLGYVVGTWGNDNSGNPIRADGFEGSNNTRVWNGLENEFVATNPNFTFAMLQWHHDQLKQGKYVKNVSFFNSGGVPIITGAGGTGQPSGSTQGNVSGSPTGGDAAGGADADQTYGSGGNPTTGTPQNDPIGGNAEDAGFPWGLIQKVKDVFSKILQGPEAFFPKGTLIGDAIQDALQGGVKNSLEYNALLPVYLGVSILTGQKVEIPIAPSAAKDMVGKIDSSELSKVITIDTPTPTTARETVNPSSGKSDAVIKDSAIGWGAQGGLNFNYNSGTGELEVTSNKTLRTTSGGETVTTADKFGGMASPGKITSFSDIPTPTTSQVQDAATKLISAVSTKLGGPGLNPDMDLDTQLELMRQRYNENDISRVAVELGLNISKTMTQGAASNIVALRKVLVDNGIVPKSDVEKIGGAYGQVSNTYKVPYEDLPKDVKKVIDQKIGVKESYTLTESRKRLLREIKQPIAEVAELKPQKLKKYKPNFKGRFTAQNTPDVTACKESDDMVRAKNAAGQTWRTADKYWGGYESTERLNVIYDHVGHGQLYWDEVVAHNQGKKGVRNRDVQEELNKHYALLAEKKQMEELGLNEQETLYAPKDPLFKRVQKKLIPQIDYEGKPSPMGYPDGPTPQQVAGWHPEYGKRSDYFGKLDPQSADAMPPTGDPEIDAKVDAQKTPLLKRVNKVRKNSGKPNS